MKVLVVGGGGREHAICWKLALSTRVEQIFCAPGNGGTAKSDKTTNIDIAVMDFDKLISFGKEQAIDLVVIGPDNPLAEGIVDKMEAAGLRVFGPNKSQAKLEWSKAYAKEVLNQLNIATARFATANSQQTAEAVVKANQWARVIKADGLALGKGVFVCSNEEEALQALNTIYKSGKFSDTKVVIEEMLSGEEISLLTLCDGRTLTPLLPSQDHKRRFDDDLGPNTGGMGAYAPVQLYEKHKEAIQDRVLEPLQKALTEGKLNFKGVLYIGLLMHQEKSNVDKTSTNQPSKNLPEPYVLEFNARFGDPETQTILPLLQSDLFDALYACTDQSLDQQKLSWSRQSSCCVIGAAQGYPESSSKGEAITLPLHSDNEQIIFQAGTKLLTTATGEQLVTDGGRIFAAVGLADKMEDARERAYNLIARVQCQSLDYRRDIAKREACQSK
ncbi:phosphoribosylamine--glycine ligase [bacterium]|nr:phosphoribosylamine--glycine ligase [bacterium]MBP9807332.1 phosphoribosylamine--glycine ligase [bacterium]